MTSRRARVFNPIAVVAAILVMSCSDAGRSDPLAEDSTLARDLALVNSDTSVRPQLADVPVKSEPTILQREVEPELVAASITPARVTKSSRASVPVVRTRDRRSATARRPSVPARVPSSERPAEQVTEIGNIERAGERGSERPLGVVSVGSEISLTSGQTICTNTNRVGDRFTAQIADPVMGANGSVIPAGATAVVIVASLERSNRAGESIEIGLRVESISFGGRTYAVQSEVTHAAVDRVRADSRGSDAGKIATGAAIGAVIGQILGGRTKSTVIGAATGAAAGAVVANRNANYEGCLPSGGRITIRLTEPLTIQVV